MKKIGKEVLFLKTGEMNPRNGESTMIRLKDGRIMLAYTEYCSEDGADHGAARISARYSSDEGESWSMPRVLMEKPSDAQNIMSPSLIRLADGGLGMVYLRKDVYEDFGMTCMPMFVRSEDEGESFSLAVSCGFPSGYYCGVNDSVLVTKSGRIYLPTSYTGERRDAMKKMNPKPIPHVSDLRISYSDDHGRSWQVLDSVLRTPYSNSQGLFEPGIFEHENGDLWLYCRTPFGHQYDTLSHDEGKTWLAVEPNCRFTSPDSPMRVKRVKDFVVAVYNPVGYNCLQGMTETWGSPKRTPIVLALSRNDGRSFNDRSVTAAGGGFLSVARSTYLLEDDLSNSYCYPSILEVRDGLLVSYYHSDGDARCLNASKVIKIYDEELEEEV